MTIIHVWMGSKDVGLKRDDSETTCVSVFIQG
jgi:hypothetical protein